MSDSLSDVHHKMSKKIAQLTKVIFHLHTKNEENQSFNGALTTAFDREVETIVKEANSIISKQRETIEKQKSMSNAADLVRSLQDKHDDEKRATQREFDEYKRKI